MTKGQFKFIVALLFLSWIGAGCSFILKVVFTDSNDYNWFLLGWFITSIVGFYIAIGIADRNEE